MDGVLSEYFNLVTYMALSRLLVRSSFTRTTLATVCIGSRIRTRTASSTSSHPTVSASRRRTGSRSSWSSRIATTSLITDTVSLLLYTAQAAAYSSYALDKESTYRIHECVELLFAVPVCLLYALQDGCVVLTL
jgi:hypothetical protein